MAVFIILLPITLTFVYGYRKNKGELKGAVLNEMIVIAEAYEGQVLQHLDVVKKRVAGLSADKTIKALAREAVAQSIQHLATERDGGHQRNRHCGVAREADSGETGARKPAPLRRGRGEGVGLAAGGEQPEHRVP